jgi:hypothetical protein
VRARAALSTQCRCDAVRAISSERVAPSPPRRIALRRALLPSMGDGDIDFIMLIVSSPLFLSSRCTRLSRRPFRLVGLGARLADECRAVVRVPHIHRTIAPSVSRHRRIRTGGCVAAKRIHCAHSPRTRPTERRRTDLGVRRQHEARLRSIHSACARAHTAASLEAVQNQPPSASANID